MLSWERKCDSCGQIYSMNKTQIPKIFVMKTMPVSDLKFIDMIASPDFCDLCILPIIRFLEKKHPLRYSVNGNRIIQSISKNL
jgi:hypothetical protein